jgi:hypothetical protein
MNENANCIRDKLFSLSLSLSLSLSSPLLSSPLLSSPFSLPLF